MFFDVFICGVCLIVVPHLSREGCASFFRHFLRIFTYIVLLISYIAIRVKTRCIVYGNGDGGYLSAMLNVSWNEEAMWTGCDKYILKAIWIKCKDIEDDNIEMNCQKIAIESSALFLL